MRYKFLRTGVFFLHFVEFSATIKKHLVLYRVQALHNGRRLAPPSGKEVRHMRITIHIGAFTVTIIVKKRGNRHSAK